VQLTLSAVKLPYGDRSTRQQKKKIIKTA